MKMASEPRTINSGHSCRIVIVDDHAMMRDGLAAILGKEPDIEIVGTAGCGRSGIEEVKKQKPDVVLVDLSMPRTDGVHAIREIKRKYPDIRAIVLTLHKDDSHIHAALEAGADAYVLKDDGRHELFAALRNVRAGKCYLSPAICERVMSGYLRADHASHTRVAASWDTLTSREREVLKLVADTECDPLSPTSTGSGH